MSNTNSLKSLIKNIADAIRNRTSKTASMSIEEMPNEIASIQGPYPTQSKSVNVKQNGEVVVTPDEGYVLDKVTANVNVVDDNNAKFYPLSLNNSYGSKENEVIKGLRYINLANFAEDINKYYTADDFLANCANLEKIDGLGAITFENCTRLGSAFYNCKKLRELDVSNFNTSKVTTMSGIFSNCESIETLDLSKWDVSNVFYLDNSFSNCQNLTGLNITSWNTKSLLSLNSAFYNCEKLRELDVSNFNTSKVTTMSLMFEQCNALETLDLSKWDVSNVTTMQEMFYRCRALRDLKVRGWNTSKLKNMGGMFAYCLTLENLDLSGWDTTSLTSTTIGTSEYYGIFTSSTSLVNVTFGNNWCPNEGLTLLRLGSSNGLNKASILDLFNKLATRTNSPTLALDNAKVKSQLTEEEIAIATNKGWIVS